MNFAERITPYARTIKNRAKNKSIDNIIEIGVLLSKRCLILLMRCRSYRQLEDSLDTWSSKVAVESIQPSKSFTTGEGLMFVPNRMTGGKDKFCVSCGTPTIRSLVLLGLINREFVEHQFAISRRSLLRLKIEY